MTKKKKKFIIKYQSIISGDIIYLDLTDMVYQLVSPPVIQMYDSGAGKCVDYIYQGRKL